MQEHNKMRVAMLTTDMVINGISTVILNYCSHIDLNKIDMTVISGAPIADIYKDGLKEKGINIRELPGRRTSVVKFYKALKEELLNNKYDILHIHCNSATITPELFIAYRCRVPVRIAHSHNSTCSHMIIHRCMLPTFNKLCTHGFACSTLAGKWLFGEKKFYVIPNGFKTERFKFDLTAREKSRQKLEVTNKFLVGHIGRFNDQKNHPFLLKVFEAIAKENPDAWLILIGGGPNFADVIKLIEAHPYKKRIIVYGETKETEKVYAAMDVFVLPSKFEGLGIVLLEAQISGLPCVSSDVVPEEVSLGNNLIRLSLSDDIEKWSSTILKHDLENRERFYKEHKEEIMKYDIVSNVAYLEELYGEFYNNGTVRR